MSAARMNVDIYDAYGKRLICCVSFLPGPNKAHTQLRANLLTKMFGDMRDKKHQTNPEESLTKQECLDIIQDFNRACSGNAALVEYY